MSWLRRFEEATRPVDDRTRAALRERWAELPDHVKTPSQTLGRAGIGCEGTHGVFPRCNFACKPCYHSEDANHVRVDGAHTVDQVRQQIGFLNASRAPHAHAQLIGGEVSLLDADDHAEALRVMRSFGREPMSFTHGDFDYAYLERLALGPDGRPRFNRLSFAVHIDTTMVGRRGMRRAEREEDLDPYRREFADMFRRLRREHGIRSFLAHNMTVTPGNVDQVPGVIRRSHAMGYAMFSFQPAAHVGDDRRWTEDYRSLDPDAVWARIEEGAGSRLPFRPLQVGDERCNRTAFGFYLGDHWHSVLDENDGADLRARDAFLRYFGGVHFNAPAHLLVPRLARAVAAHPDAIPIGASWLRRTVHRVGGPRALLRHRVAPVTFVMHRFMHAEDVQPAWDLLERGEMSDDPRIRETQERLQACSYAMAHPENGRIVPACVQHSVLDPEENRRLRVELPRLRVRTGSPAPNAIPGAQVFDSRIRSAIAPPLEAAGRSIAARGVSPGAVTAAGWVVGAGACVAAATAQWAVALGLWLGNRLLDGLDGPVARARGATDRGGFLDVVADFSVYAGFVVAVAIAVPPARLACVVLLFTYYLSGTALLALSSLLERRRQSAGDGRSLRLTGGLAEGFETIVAYVAFCLLPGSAATIAWVFAGAVGLTAVQRVAAGARLLGD